MVHPLQRTGRLAGFLYLLVVLSGPFVLLYVPGKLLAGSNPSTTAANILAHESLYRAYIVVGILAELAFVSVALVLYRLLQSVNANLAAVMAILVLIDAPMSFFGVANQVATLAFLHHPELLAAFDQPQRDALATLMLSFDRKGVLVSEVFWGLWLLPLGILVYRSGFIPRLLGIWLFVNGVAYLLISSTGLMWPEYVKVVDTVTMPVLFGEVAFMLWLLIVGARAQPSRVTTSQVR